MSITFDNTALRGATDAALCAASVAGDHQAFGQIVERYQNLVCTIAYSGLGDLGRSEDVAQETFVIAWKKLADLQEPARLKSWLCGIVRNLVSNARRRMATDLNAQAETLDTHEPACCGAPASLDQAIRREEEALLWSVLSTMPETYREPLVLYHRGQYSVAEVAVQLDLTEDTVKQRLSRGRKLLKAEMAVFVEQTLRASRPGTAFAAAVLAALPAAAPQAMAVGLAVTAQGGGGKAAAAGGSAATGAFLGPFLGLIGALLGVMAGIAGARSPRERRFMVQFVIIMFVLVAALLAIQKICYTFFPGAYQTVVFQSVFWSVYTLALVLLILWGKRRGKQIHEEESPASSTAGGNETVAALNDAPVRAVTWSLAAIMYSVVACCVVLPGVSAGDWWAPAGASAVTTIVWFGIKRRLEALDSLQRRIGGYLVAVLSAGAIAIVTCSMRWSAWQAAAMSGNLADVVPLWMMNALILATCGGCAVLLILSYRSAR